LVLYGGTHIAVCKTRRACVFWEVFDRVVLSRLLLLVLILLAGAESSYGRRLAMSDGDAVGWFIMDAGRSWSGESARVSVLRYCRSGAFYGGARCVARERE
jgi:hypothetical protein